MDEGTDTSAGKVPESPKPLAFTIDFGSVKAVDTQRQKALAEKLKKRHKRGQSLSKLEETKTSTPLLKQHPLTGNLPRKSSFQSEGYFSSDEKNDRTKTPRGSAKRSDLTLLLKNVTTDRMTQSFPNHALPNITSPEEIELKDVSSPELVLISPFSPREQLKSSTNCNLTKQQFSSPECEKLYVSDIDKDSIFVDGAEMDFDKSDTVSDAGTYTLDADNYSEEQKARMSIDKDFKIEQVSVQKKTEEYIKSLSAMRDHLLQGAPNVNKFISKETEVTKGVQAISLLSPDDLTSTTSPTTRKIDKLISTPPQSKSSGKVLSPIMSPTQNISITENIEEDLNKTLNNGECDVLNKTFTKIISPSPKAKRNGLEQVYDHGSVISVTSSGAFKPKIEKKRERRYSLSKSEVQVQAYIDGKNYTDGVVEPIEKSKVLKWSKPKLTANIVNVQSIDVKKPNVSHESSPVVSANIMFEKVSNISPTTCQTPNLPPTVGGYSGKSSPTKIPSPIHTISRPRSRTGSNSVNIEFSDSSLDTDLILKPTQNYINSLQQRLSLDSDVDSDYDAKYGIQLNNTAHLLKQKASHTRHNSLDDRTINISNKLEHFQNKNLQGIDQTYTNLFNQYSQNKVMHKIQNSPNNSPIKRSSSFSTKNQIHSAKNTNIVIPQKESNLSNSPNLTRNSSIQRSSSTACIKPNYITNRRQSIGDNHKVGQYGDTESSSEDDFERNLQMRKDSANITNTRCNRAFSLRRARVYIESLPMKCPNTPEMRRKNLYPEIKQERAISVDRKPMKTNDVQSRYLLNISKRGTPPPPTSKVEVRNSPKVGSVAKTTPNRPQAFSRTDSGRFSMRTSSKPPLTSNISKGPKKDAGKKQGGTRSNSSLSSREVEFQNWKRRKSYDPMKAAAEGKKKEIAKRQSVGQNVMTQSYIESNHSQDSSPSHSSSVHRSQSFHGTAALEQLISSEEEEEDLTLSADEGFSPPTPSPCELSPARASLRQALWERIRH